MPKDGDIDYRTFSRARLADALRNIDARQYPINYAAILKELEDRPPEPMEAVATDSLPPVLMRGYVAWMALGTVALVATAAASKSLLGAPSSSVVGLASAGVSIFGVAWHFVRKYRRPFAALELKRLFLGCAIVFSAIDHLVWLPFNFVPDVARDGLTTTVLVAIAGAVFDWIAIALIVLWLVPRLVRHILLPSNNSLDGTRGG